MCGCGTRSESGKALDRASEKDDGAGVVDGEGIQHGGKGSRGDRTLTKETSGAGDAVGHTYTTVL